jgi:biopolymer transport protein ExbD
MTAEAGTDFAHVGARGAGARAQLLLALLLAAVAPFFVIGRPIEQHALRFDLRPLQDWPAAASPAAEMRPVSLLAAPREPQAGSRIHRLVATADGRILVDGSAVDHGGLRERLDSIAVTETEWVDFRPEPDVRYEHFAEILATVKRAHLERLRFDNRRFRDAMDEDGAGRHSAL